MHLDEGSPFKSVSYFSTQITVRRNQSYLTYFLCAILLVFFKDQYLKSLCTYAASCPGVNTRFLLPAEKGWLNVPLFATSSQAVPAA